MAVPPGMKVIYHITDGASPPMHTIDANVACLQHPLEWKPEPWGPDPQAAGATMRTTPMAENADDVEIPDDWKEMSHARIRALAMKLGAPMTIKGDEAEEMIAAEVKRRKAKPTAGDD